MQNRANYPCFLNDNIQRDTKATLLSGKTQGHISGLSFKSQTEPGSNPIYCVTLGKILCQNKPVSSSVNGDTNEYMSNLIACYNNWPYRLTPSRYTQ